MKRIVKYIFIIVGIILISMGIYLSVNKDTSSQEKVNDNKVDKYNAVYGLNNDFIKIFRLENNEVFVIFNIEELTNGVDCVEISKIKEDDSIQLGTGDNSVTFKFMENKVLFESKEFSRKNDYSLDDYYKEKISPDEDYSYNYIYKKDNYIIKILKQDTTLKLVLFDEEKNYIEYLTIPENNEVTNYRIKVKFNNDFIEIESASNNTLDEKYFGKYNKISTYDKISIIKDLYFNYNI